MGETVVVGSANRAWSRLMVATVVTVVTLVCVATVAIVLPSGGPATATASASVTRPAAHPFRGLGAWVDMYSWSETFTANQPKFLPSDIDAMAAAGVQTLFIQGASQTGPAAVLEPERLATLIARAHRFKMSVVVWYLPSLVNTADDLARLVAVSRLPAEGVGVDIESLDVADVGQRNAALIALSQQTRSALPGRPIGAIVMPSTLLEVVNPHFWPDFPWRAIAPLYDAWLPMTYWTFRLPASGWNDGYTYAADSMKRLRLDLGLAAPEIAPIGGDAASVGPAAVDRFVAAVRDFGGTGGSLYEWGGTAPADYSHLSRLRR